MTQKTRFSGTTLMVNRKAHHELGINPYVILLGLVSLIIISFNGIKSRIFNKKI